MTLCLELIVAPHHGPHGLMERCWLAEMLPVQQLQHQGWLQQAQMSQWSRQRKLLLPGQQAMDHRIAGRRRPHPLDTLQLGLMLRRAFCLIDIGMSSRPGVWLESI